MKTALQLYSVRDAFERDPAATIERAAGFGLDGLEVWDLLGHDARAVRGWLDDAGLVACSFNMDLDEFEADPRPAFRNAEALGTGRLVVSWLPPSTEASVTARYAERFAAAALTARAAGFELGFHLHAEEYDTADDGSVLVDRLLADAPALFLEIDLGWAWFAGRDLAQLIAAAAGRCPLVHCKDFASGSDRDSYTALGEGAVPFADALRDAAAAGVEWIVAEQDDAFVPDELGAAERSCRALLALRDDLVNHETPR